MSMYAKTRVLRKILMAHGFECAPLSAVHLDLMLCARGIWMPIIGQAGRREVRRIVTQARKLWPGKVGANAHGYFWCRTPYQTKRTWQFLHKHQGCAARTMRKFVPQDPQQMRIRRAK